MSYLAFILSQKASTVALFFAEEQIGIHLPLNSQSEFQLKLQNENSLRFNPDEDNGEGAGKARPTLSYSQFLSWGDITLALGTPLTYPLWGGEGILFGIEPKIAYITPFWLGFKTALKFIAAPAPSFDGMEFAVNYTQNQFYGALTFNAKESFNYFSLKAEFNYFFNFASSKPA
jgi:hypothetical protein